MYTVIDLIDKLIEIEKSGNELYIRMSANAQAEERVKIVAKVFSNQESKHVDIYENLRKSVYEYKDIEVDFNIYDKAVKLIYEFSRLKITKDITKVKDLLEFSLMFEKENLALVLSIRGLFVKSQQDLDTGNYKILSEIIKEEQKHIRDIEALLK
jgi:rubrerythrin